MRQKHIHQAIKLDNKPLPAKPIDKKKNSSNEAEE